MRWLFRSLRDNKGVYASTLGFLMAVPVNVNVVFMFFNNIEFTDGQLKTALTVNLIAVFWVMLPSIIELSAGAFKLIIKD